MEHMQAYGQTKLIQQTLQQHLELDTHKRQREDNIETWREGGEDIKWMISE